MHRLAAVVLVATLVPGCITTMGLIKHQQDVTKTNLIEMAVIDLAASTLFMFTAEALSGPAAALTGIAVTAADLGVACVLGTCQVLRP